MGWDPTEAPDSGQTNNPSTEAATSTRDVFTSAGLWPGSQQSWGSGCCCHSWRAELRLQQLQQPLEGDCLKHDRLKPRTSTLSCPWCV